MWKTVTKQELPSPSIHHLKAEQQGDTLQDLTKAIHEIPCLIAYTNLVGVLSSQGSQVREILRIILVHILQVQLYLAEHCKTK